MTKEVERADYIGPVRRFQLFYLQELTDGAQSTKAMDISPEVISRLCQNIFVDSITVDHMRFALSGLRKEILPSPKSGPDNPFTKRAFPCLNLLSKCLIAARANSKLAHDSVSLLVSACDGICAWIHQLILEMMLGHMSGNRQSERLQTAYKQWSKILYYAISLHPTIQKAYLRSDEFLTLCMYLWTSSDPSAGAGRKHVFFVNWDDPSQDYILQLTLRIVRDPFGRATLVRKSNNFTSKAKNTAPAWAQVHIPEGLRRLVTSLIQRTMQMRWAIETPGRFVTGMVEFAGDVTKVLEGLCETEDEDLSKHLADANYLTEFSLLQHACIVALGKAPSSELLDIVLDSIAILTRIVGRQVTGASHSWAHVISGKIIPTLAHLAVCVSPADAPKSLKDAFVSVVQSMTAATLYPRVLDLLLTTPSVTDTRNISEDLKRPQAASLWDPLWNTIQMRLRIWKEVKNASSFGLCDNPRVSISVSIPSTRLRYVMLMCVSLSVPRSREREPRSAGNALQSCTVRGSVSTKTGSAGTGRSVGRVTSIIEVSVLPLSIVSAPAKAWNLHVFQ
ncbi:hypothetical protein NMY22_g5144 [Coprinellus aureogranulatus]|nr:hypothetical protein NMY22_g5144 [Coprinellus aureogranulatus]